MTYASVNLQYRYVDFWKSEIQEKSLHGIVSPNLILPSEILFHKKSLTISTIKLFY